MGRSQVIAKAIVRAITGAKSHSPARLQRILFALLTFFKLYDLPLRKVSPELFSSLRVEHWGTQEDVYVKSFTAGAEARPEDALSAIGDMGYSGSTFFCTQDGRWLVKSVPRHFEHSFFRDDFMQPYTEHMSSKTNSLLVRICEFLASPYYPLGSLLGLAPTHHVVMENILYGQREAESTRDTKWETWDLKPTSYFFPERDIASGKLTSKATKDKLADKFEDKMVLTPEQADQFISQLENDTKLLANCNAVDYSLFLVRIALEQEDPFADVPDSSSLPDDLVPTIAPFVPPEPPSWRTGVISPDGKHIFRAAVLDFFWAKHKMQPKMMTGLIKMWNIAISRQGHMSITTAPEEYRERFLKMCREMIEVQDR